MGLQFNTVPQQQNWGVGGAGTHEPVNNTQTGPRGLLFGDTIQSAIGNVISFLYLQDIGLPILPPPKASGGETFFYNQNSFSNPNFPTSERDTTSPYESTYLKTFDGVLEQAVKTNGLSEEEAKQITFAAMMGIPIPNNPKLNQILGDIQGKVLTQMNQTFGTDGEISKNNWSQVTDQAKSDFQKSLGRAFEGSFQKNLEGFAKTNGLTSSQIAQLQYAHYNPDAPVSDEIKQLLGQLNGQVLSQLGPQWGIPEGFTPQVDNTEFNALVSFNYEEAFKGTLQNADLSQLANQLGISEDALKGIINYLHGQTDKAGGMNLQQLGLNNASQLQQIVQFTQQLESKAAGQIASASGLPNGVIPNDGGKPFQQMLDGRVLQQFEYNLKNQSPPLNEQQIAEVLLAVKNPLDPNISTEVKTIIDNVFSQAVSEVRSDYNVPQVWSTNLSVLGNLGNQGPDVKMANAGIQFASDSLNIALKYLDPKNPNDAVLINVIKAVETALSQLKSTIAEMQMQNSQMQSKITEARNQANLYKIKIQNEKLEKALKQARKMKPLMAFMKIFGPIFKAIMAIIFSLFVPIGPLLAASMFQDIATDGKQNFITDMFKKIMEGLPRPANIVVSAAVMWAMVCCATVPNPMMFMQIFFENSRILQEVSKACGADDQTAEMVSMISKIAAEVVVMIVVTILTGGAAGAALMGQISSAATQVTIKVLQTVLSAIQKIIARLKEIGGVASKAAEILEKFANAILTKIQKLQQVLEKIGESTQILNQIENTKTALKPLEKGTEQANQLTKQLEILEESLKKIDDSIKELGGNVFENIRKTMITGTSIAQAATAGVQAAKSIMQAQLDKFKSEMDAQIEELQNLVRILTDTLQKLMEGMSSMVNWTGEIGKQQAHMWQNLSQTTTAIANAGQS